MKIKSLHLKNLILVAIFALMSGSLWAYDFVVHYENVSIDDVVYTYDIYYSIIDADNHYVAVVNNGNTRTYGGTGREKMEVPERVTYNDITYTVTAIASHAFDLNGSYTAPVLLKVVLPESITSIGSSAFLYCGELTTVNIPPAVTSIGSSAFRYCSSLTDITIPDGITSIAEEAFMYCFALTSINIPNSVTSVGAYAFHACNHVTSLTIGTGLTSVGNYAFSPLDALATINYNAAHMNSGLGVRTNTDCTLTIGSDVTYLPNSAFSGFTRLTTLNFAASSQAITIDAYAFKNCTGLTSISFGDRSYEIGSNAFEGCTGLTTLTIPSGVTKIRQSAFKDCSNLATIYYNATNCLIEGASSGFSSACAWYGLPACTLIIGDNVTILRSSAFRFFTGLTNLTIGAGVVNIGDYAFAGCSNLASVTYNATSCTTVSYNIWDGCTHPCTLIIGSGVVSLPNSSSKSSYGIFKGFTGLSEITIPSNVTSIGDYTFADCTGLATINFNAPSCTIGGNYSNLCWNGCTHECTLNIGDNVSGLSDRAFSGLTGLKTINFGSHVSFSIPEKAFSGTGLTELVIPNFVTSIGKEAFSGCGSLTSLTIGTGVTTIGNWAFNSCNHLTTVNYNATNCTSAGDQSWPTFDNCGNGTNCTLTIGNNVTRLPQRIFYRFSGLTSFSIGTGLGSISDYAFVNCTCLTSINIPNNVTSIGSSAFDGCTSVTTLDLGTGVQTIETLAFDGCTGLTSLTIPASVTLIDAASWGGNGAFKNCSNLEEIWFEGTTYPAFEAHAFDGVTSTIPVYVPRGCNYPTTGAWSYFTNYIPYSRFAGTNNNSWGESGNWSFGIPQYNETALINAEATIASGYTATVGHIAFKGTDSRLIISNGGQLSCNSIAAPDNIYVNIRDGGQLVCNTEANATLERSIVAHGENGDDGWYFIASPAKTAIGPSVANGLLSNEYDLYRYYEDDYTWHNYKVTTFPLSNSWGYLYANNTNNTLHFGGTMLAANAEVTVENLDYASPYAPLRGFNLMGNPFTHNLTVGDITLDGTTLTTYYMVENGKEIVVASLSETPIKPGRGFMVQATAAGQDLVFNPSAKGNAPKVGYISITAGNGTFTDKAFVQVGGGNTLRKLTMGDDTPKVYVQQGGADYAAATVEATNNVVLIGFEAAENGTYTIAVDIKDVETNYLHLVDNMTGAEIDLLSTPSYTFNAKTMDYASRFKLVFNANSAFENENGDNETFAYFNGSEWVVNASNDATIQIVDMMGRVIRSLDVARNVSTNGMTPGIYVLRLIQGNNVKTQKIVVE